MNVEHPTLAVTLHDPESRQFKIAQEVFTLLWQYFGAICVSASDKVDQQFIDFLVNNGAIVKQSVRSIGEGRRDSLDMALGQRSDYIQYCDFDRILHWIRNFPDELPLVAATIRNVDFLILGRTERAFQTHPRVQQVTEKETNQAFSEVLGKTVDVTAGSSMMIRGVAQIIVQESKSNINDTDTEWPLLADEHSMRIEHLALEGLEFETPDYYQEEIGQAGGLLAWLEIIYEQPEMWQYRTEMTRQSVKRITEYLERKNLLS